MKKHLTKVLMLSIVSIALAFNACKKDTTDTTPPVITLTGSGSITINLGDTYTDPGATAKDDKDGDVTSKITVTGIPANTYQVGTYTITYNVSDAAGNAATPVTRTLIIKADKLAGSYQVKETGADTTNYAVTVSTSSIATNKVIISNFGNYGNSASISVTVNLSNITIDQQSFTAHDNTYNVDITFTISGTSGTYDGSTFTINTINYTSQYTYNGTQYTYNYVDSFSKQKKR